MKTNQYIILGASWLLSLSLLTACNDAWDEHYVDFTGTSTDDAPTLLEHLQKDDDLQEFLRVAKHIGYDAVLAAPQKLTLWAPVITKAQADSVIAVYEAQKLLVDDKGARRQDKDNAAVTQFLQNHIALYGRSTNSTTNDTVRMWNGKYMTMTDASLNGIPYLKKNLVASNGIMFKLDGKEAFLPNVRESFQLNTGLDSVTSFYESFDRYEIDTEESIQRDIVDGEVVYADSVINLSNILYNYLGYIHREDSSYLFFAPTKEVWKSEYERFLPQFNYASENTEDRIFKDSLTVLNTRLAIISGRVFNLKQQKNNYEDSIKNTMYYSSPKYYGLNVFPKPKAAYDATTGEGIFGGLTPITCSNGLLYLDNEGRINPRLTIQQARYVDITKGHIDIRAVPLGKDGDTWMNQSSVDMKSVTDSIEVKIGEETKMFRFEKLKEKNYLEIKPNSFSQDIDGYNALHDTIYFYLPNTFSNMYYNVYVVMVPEFADRDGYTPGAQIPSLRFRAGFKERNNGEAGTSTNPSDDVYFLNTTDSKEEELKSVDGSKNFNYDGTDVKVIPIDIARKFTYASYDETGSLSYSYAQRYRISSYAQQSNINKGTQTNVMRINRVIYIPFETKKEAEDFKLADDLSNIKEYSE